MSQHAWHNISSCSKTKSVDGCIPSPEIAPPALVTSPYEMVEILLICLQTTNNQSLKHVNEVHGILSILSI